MSDPRIPVEELVTFLEDFAGDKDGAGGFDACDWNMVSLESVERDRKYLREAAARLREEYL